MHMGRAILKKIKAECDTGLWKKNAVRISTYIVQEDEHYKICMVRT